MKVDKIFETPDGHVHFQGELKGKELDAVITVGLNYLLQCGALPFLVNTSETKPTDEKLN